jgi:hypothetical protein
MISRAVFAIGLFLFAAFASTVTTASVHYVDVNSTNPVSPYLDWSTAATNIQQALDATPSGDSVLVTDGIYRAPAGALSTVTIVRNIQLHSVNGPGNTIIEGSSTGTLPRGVGLLSSCVLDGFTVRNGGLTSEPSGIRPLTSGVTALVTNCVISANKGGGVYVPNYVPMSAVSLVNCVISNNAGPGVMVGSFSAICALTNCALIGNSGIGAGRATLSQCVVAGNLQGGLSNCTAAACQITNNIGRGAFFYSTLYRCLLRDNYSTNANGAAIADSYAENSLIISNRASGTPPANSVIYSTTANACKLVNCTIAYNSTPGGSPCLDHPTITNCIIWKNFSGNSDTFNFFEFVRNCCLTQTGGDGSFTNDPLFIDPDNGDFRLQSNSPCINAGFIRATMDPLDYAGNARIAGGALDVGAYEYQTPTSLLSYIWAQTNGLPTDGSADFADPDGDGMNNFQECRAGTSPTNALSVLVMQAPTSTNWQRAVKLTWQSTPGTLYSIERSGNAGNGSFGILRSNIAGFAGTMTYTDTNVSSGGPYFYRVGVQ